MHQGRRYEYVHYATVQYLGLNGKKKLGLIVEEKRASQHTKIIPAVPYTTKEIQKICPALTRAKIFSGQPGEYSKSGSPTQHLNHH
jgi:hypothetical protein